MSEDLPRPPLFPRAPLIGAGALVAFSLVAAITGRMTGSHAIAVSETAVAVRDLRFEDRADGAVVVSDADDDRTVKVVTGQNGFLRGTLRGLARTRKSEGIGPAAPFRLAAWSDGRLTLDDPSTGRHVELEAFGPTNTAVFGRLLDLRRGAT